MERKMTDGNGPASRRGPYRRRTSRPVVARVRRDVLIELGPLDRLVEQTALMILAGGAVGVTGPDAFHTAAAASLASARSGIETAQTARMIRAVFDLLALPGVAAIYRRVGRDAWRQYREMREQAEARMLRATLEELAPPATLH